MSNKLKEVIAQGSFTVNDLMKGKVFGQQTSDGQETLWSLHNEHGIMQDAYNYTDRNIELGDTVLIATPFSHKPVAAIIAVI